MRRLYFSLLSLAVLSNAANAESEDDGLKRGKASDWLASNFHSSFLSCVSADEGLAKKLKQRINVVPKDLTAHLGRNNIVDYWRFENVDLGAFLGYVFRRQDIVDRRFPGTAQRYLGQQSIESATSLLKKEKAPFLTFSQSCAKALKASVSADGGLSELAPAERLPWLIGPYQQRGECNEGRIEGALHA